jgi:hypothetical protein
MLALALLVLNHVTVIDVARGVAAPDRVLEIEGARIRGEFAAAGYRPPPVPSSTICLAGTSCRASSTCTRTYSSRH